MLKRYNQYGINIRPVYTDNLYFSGDYLVGKGEYTAKDSRTIETSHLTLSGEQQTFLFTNAGNPETFKFYQYTNAVLPTIDGDDDGNNRLDVIPERSAVFLNGKLLYDTSLYTIQNNSITIDYKSLGLLSSDIVRINILGANTGDFGVCRFKTPMLTTDMVDINGIPCEINRYRTILFCNDHQISSYDISWHSVDNVEILNYNDGDIITVITVPKNLGAVFYYATKDGQSTFSGYDLTRRLMEYTPYSRGVNCNISVCLDYEFYFAIKPETTTGDSGATLASECIKSIVDQLNAQLATGNNGEPSTSKISFDILGSGNDTRILVNNPCGFPIRISDNASNGLRVALGLPEIIESSHYIGKACSPFNDPIWIRRDTSLFISFNMTTGVWSTYVQWIHTGDFLNTSDGGLIKITSSNFDCTEIMGDIIQAPAYSSYTMDFLDKYAYAAGSTYREYGSLNRVVPRLIVRSSMAATKNSYSIVSAPMIAKDGLFVPSDDKDTWKTEAVSPEALNQPWWLSSHENIPMEYYMTAGQKEGVYLPEWVHALSRVVIDDYHCKVDTLYRQWNKKYTIDSNLVNMLSTLGVKGFAFGEFESIELRNMLEEINYFYRQVGTLASYRFTGMMTESDFGVIEQLWTSDYITFGTPSEIDPSYKEDVIWIPNEPIDYGLIRNVATKFIDRGSCAPGVVGILYPENDWGYVTGDVGGHWQKVVVSFNPPEGYYPTNHVRSEIDYGRFKDLIETITSVQLFYNLASAPVVYDQMYYVIDFEDSGNGEPGGTTGDIPDADSTNTIRIDGGAFIRGEYYFRCEKLTDWESMADSTVKLIVNTRPLKAQATISFESEKGKVDGNTYTTVAGNEITYTVSAPNYDTVTKKIKVDSTTTVNIVLTRTRN